MRRILRSVLAVLAGLAAAMPVMLIFEGLGAWLCFPPGVDIRNPEALREAIAQAPPIIYLFPLLSHAGAPFVGAWLAARLAGRSPLVHGLVVGGLFQIAGIANLIEMSHPAWFIPIDLALYLPAAWLGAKLAGGKEARTQPPADAVAA
jgi:hypothetical protein